jgi:hypothetical protein
VAAQKTFIYVPHEMDTLSKLEQEFTAAGAFLAKEGFEQLCGQHFVSKAEQLSIRLLPRYSIVEFHDDIGGRQRIKARTRPESAARALAWARANKQPIA